MSKTSIEWTDRTWNPVRGCTKISPGCKHCYAKVFAERWRGIDGHPYEDGFDLRLAPHKILEPLRWAKPRMVFVNSMSDLFHDDVPDAYIRAVFDVMIAAKWHTFQVLTKRPGRMAFFLENNYPDLAKAQNIWLGVSVEDRAFGLPRIPILKTINAHVRFLSIEPLIENIGFMDLTGIQWVIVGGESGPGSRAMAKDWVNTVFVACAYTEVPFFFKQWGGVRHKGGRIFGERIWDEMPPISVEPIKALAQRRLEMDALKSKHPWLRQSDFGPPQALRPEQFWEWAGSE